MSEKEMVYMIDHQELDILEAICGIRKYWGIVSGSQMDRAQMNRRLFEMYQKKMIYPEGEFYQITDTYKNLLQYINKADAMMEIKIKGDYQQDCFCYIRDKILIATENARKSGQARYEFIEKNAFGQFLEDGEYLPDKNGENLEDLDYGLTITYLSPDGQKQELLDVIEEKGMFSLWYRNGDKEKTEAFSLKRFEDLLWKKIGEV